MTLSPLLTTQSAISVSVAVAVAVLTTLGECHSGWRTTMLETALRHYLSQLRSEGNVPVAASRGASRGVAFEMMRRLQTTFAEYVRDRNAYYLIGNLVLPITKPWRLSFSEVFGGVRMEWCVSHFWGSS